MRNIVVLYILLCLVLFSGLVFCEETPKIGVFFIEIIIKVKPDVIIMPEGFYKAPINQIVIRSEGIKELNKKFNLISMERMYAKKRPKEEVAEEFPQRESRAPQEAEEPDLEDTFLLKFPEHIDPDLIIKEYENLEEVIYAEENISLEIF